MNNKEPLRVYTDGIFDLCHYGHGNVFEQIKKHFGNCTIIVGVMNDIDCHKYKGLTVMTNTERVNCLLHFKNVDEVLPNAPWIITKEFLNEHNIDFCAYHDLGKYNSGIDGHAVPKKLGIFYQIEYTNGISTTELINRIIKNVDNYIERNINKI